ncbi:MAG: sugar nucleotide-binding protein [Verrucomicrobiales bacterium]|nr:sugar nucleotide-binding protein [Verrucomicrobiales bacterium]
MNQRILLLGATGYVGQAFQRLIAQRGGTVVSLSRSQADYTRFAPLLRVLREVKPDFLVNCAGYTGKPNVDACEKHQADTLLGNVSLPQTLAQACEVANVPWGHVSSGCIYAGAKIVQPDGSLVVEKDLTRPDLRRIVDTEPSRVRGFLESDTPNFSFRSPPCSFYSGSKALGEEVLAGAPGCYIWRLRIPFDEVDGMRNYLTKLQRYDRVYDNVNSISHLADFAQACIGLRELGAPFGTYNVTNPGFVTSRQVIQRILEKHRPARTFTFWESDEEFYRVAAKTPRSNCVMDVTKLLATGVKMRPVDEALDDALTRWQPEKK